MNSDSPPGANATRLAWKGPTRVACLTPPGRGAIAVLGIRGPRAWEIVRELFRGASAISPKLPAAPEMGRLWLGRMGEKDSAKVADEVVVTAVQITPVPWVEVHCHGGIETVRWLMEILEAQGCQSCSWPDLERAATTDPWKTAAAIGMIQATTVRTAAVLLDQYHGAFAGALAQIRSALAKTNLIEMIQLLEALARYADVGRHLTTPWRVAVIGAPNVGKSSLANVLAGFQRSVVTATPGTTRDLVTTLIAVDGWPVELVDTAGLRDEPESLEGQGIDLARQAAAEADLCLWILDASTPAIWPETDLRKHPKMKLIVNKTDLPAAWDISTVCHASGPGHFAANPQHDAVPTPNPPRKHATPFLVSARTGAGLGELIEALAGWLVPNPPPPGAAVPFTSALTSRVEEALTLARAGRIQELKQILAALANEPR